jgi:hypothetical protein
VASRELASLIDKSDCHCGPLLRFTERPLNSNIKTVALTRKILTTINRSTTMVLRRILAGEGGNIWNGYVRLVITHNSKARSWGAMAEARGVESLLVFESSKQCTSPLAL